MEPITINNLIISDPNISHGKPTFKGTRIMVWQILELLEQNQSKDQIYSSYPTLPKGAIEAALDYATKKVKETSLISFGND